jgi:hypothetical protein
MENEIPSQLSDFLLRFSKANNLSEDWVERFKAVLIRWVSNTPEPIKADFLSCVREVEASTNKPGRIRKFFSGLFKEVLRQLVKDPGGKCRYQWADKAYFMRQELKLNYEFIYPAVCQDATGKRLEELTDSERQGFEEQCRSLVYQRRANARKEQKK